MTRFALPVSMSVILTALGAAQGGYFPLMWAWPTVGLLCAALAVLLLRRQVLLGGLERLVLGAFALLLGWTALSALWATSTPQAVLEFQRTLLYASACLVILLFARECLVAPLLAGTLAAVTLVAAYGMARHLLFPEEALGAERLAQPLGYANGFGIFTAVGALLALGFATRGASWRARAGGGASLGLLLPALHLSFSRGAWLALAFGIIVALALDGRLIRSLGELSVVLLAPATAIWLVAGSDGLTDGAAGVGAGNHGALAATILALAAVSAGLAGSLGSVRRRVRLPARVRRLLAVVLAAGAAGSFVGVVAYYGSPKGLIDSTHRAFEAPPTAATDLNARLFTLSGTFRTDLWQAAWSSHREHPLLGSGAGGYEQYWLENRAIDLKVRDAHNLYLETLAELGPLGVLALVIVLAVPALAALRARRQPLVPTVAGAYAAYLLHGAVDWDWELPAVTLTALVCASVLLVYARRSSRRPLSRSSRALALLLTLVVSGIAVAALAGQSALHASAVAAGNGGWHRAESQARTAARWMPLSGEPWRRMAEAQMATGHLAPARMSFREAIARDPRNWLLWVGLARASEGDARAEALRSAERLNPLSPEIALLRREWQLERGTHLAQGASGLGR